MKDYDTTQIKVPLDYGKARCASCGGRINPLKICVQCHAQWSAEDLAFIRKDVFELRQS